MKLAVKDFGNRLKAAQGEAVGLFYYAGHGIQVNGENFLVPVDAPIEDEGDVDIYAVGANGILRTIEDARNGLNIVILDACRNNPYARSFRAASRGLATMSAPTGTLIAYSTAPGQVAADGGSLNSPYTAALAEAIAEPGVPLELMFKNVRDAVLKATQGRQTPWEASSLTGADFYLAATPGAVTEPQAVPPPRTGDNAACPANEMEPAGSICRSAAGLCDRVETCNGVAPSCPADAFFSIGVVCRPAQDVCDSIDICRGNSPICVDNVRGPNFVCRPAVDSCDLTDTCNGTDIACPGDLMVDCTDGQSCTLDSCDVVLGCVNEPQAGCVPLDHFSAYNALGPDGPPVTLVDQWQTQATDLESSRDTPQPGATPMVMTPDRQQQKQREIHP